MREKTIYELVADPDVQREIAKRRPDSKPLSDQQIKGMKTTQARERYKRKRPQNSR